MGRQETRRTHVRDAARDAADGLPVLEAHGDVEVCEVRVAVRVEEDVVRLDIPMDDVSAVEVGESTRDFCDPETDGYFTQGITDVEVD